MPTVNKKINMYFVFCIYDKTYSDKQSWIFLLLSILYTYLAHMTELILISGWRQTWLQFYSTVPSGCIFLLHLSG